MPKQSKRKYTPEELKVETNRFQIIKFLQKYQLINNQSLSQYNQSTSQFTKYHQLIHPLNLSNQHEINQSIQQTSPIPIHPLNLSNQHSIYQSIQQTSQNSIQHKIPSHLTNQSFQLINQPIPVTQRNYPLFQSIQSNYQYIQQFPYVSFHLLNHHYHYIKIAHIQSTHDDDTDTTGK